MMFILYTDDGVEFGSNSLSALFNRWPNISGTLWVFSGSIIGPIDFVKCLGCYNG